MEIEPIVQLALKNMRAYNCELRYDQTLNPDRMSIKRQKQTILACLNSIQAKETKFIQRNL